MDDYELIYKYIQLKYDPILLRDVSKYDTPDEKKERRIKRASLSEIKIGIDKLEQSSINKAVKEMIVFLNQLIDLVDVNKRGIGLSRSQGLMYDNYLFIKLKMEIIWAMQGPLGTIPVVHLYYTDKKDDSYSKDELFHVIGNYKNMLEEKNKIVKYSQFEEIIDRLLDELEEIRTKELNQTNNSN